MAIDYEEARRKREKERGDLLAEIGITEDDVFEDDKGEYYLQEPSLMDEGENESGKSRKIYLE